MIYIINQEIIDNNLKKKLNCIENLPTYFEILKGGIQIINHPYIIIIIFFVYVWESYSNCYLLYLTAYIYIL